MPNAWWWGRLLNWQDWKDRLSLEHERALRDERSFSILRLAAVARPVPDASPPHASHEFPFEHLLPSLATVCRNSDVIGCNAGRDELLVFAPDTHAHQAERLAERMHAALRALDRDSVSQEDEPSPSWRTGVAAGRWELWEEVFDRAGQALHRTGTTPLDWVPAGSHEVSVATAPPDASSPNDSPTVRAAVPHNGQVMLVSTGSAEVRQTVASLRSRGYDVCCAEDHAAAQKLITADPPDVILLDTMLPGGEALESLRHLKTDSSSRDVPVVLISPSGDPGDIQRGLDIGADEYVSTSIPQEDLALRVRTMIRLRRQQRSLVRSYELRGEQTRVLVHLLEFSRALATASQLEEVLEHTVTVTSQICAARQVALLRPDAAAGALVLAAGCGLPADTGAKLRIPIGAPIAGEVFSTGHRFILNTSSWEAWEERAHDAALFKSPPLVSTPLYASGQIVGVLEIAERMGHCPFSPQELEYIDMIANTAGPAIHALLSRHSRDQARDSIVIALAKLAEHRDNDTGRHVDRVTQYALVLADELHRQNAFPEITEAFMRNLERATPLHDIGKVAIPDRILLKPGRLTPEEMAAMKPHTEIGAETIHSVNERSPGVGFLQMAEDIAHCHHEWWDGSGYPRAWRGLRIPLSARIVALADVYDALTTQRVYKEAFTHERSIAIVLESSGTQFDPRIVEAFYRRRHDFATLAKEMADPVHRPLASSPTPVSAETG